MSDLETIAYLAGKKGGVVKKIKKFMNEGKGVPKVLLTELDGYEKKLKEKQGSKAGEKAEKRRERQKTAYTAKKKARAEEAKRVALEIEEGLSDDTTSQGSAYESGPRTFVPDWTATPMGYKRYASSNFEDATLIK